MKNKDITLGKGGRWRWNWGRALAQQPQGPGFDPRLTKRKIKDRETKTEGT